VVVIIIDPDGLFHGKRLARCSDHAQLFFPRLLLASNGYGRLEIDFDRIRYEAFWTFRHKPTDERLEEVVQEYAKNFLLFLYVAQGQTWAQWDVAPNWLPRYKNAADRRSPAPDPEAFKNWLNEVQSLKTKLFPRVSASFREFPKISESFENFPQVSESFCPAVAVAVAVAGAVAVAVAESSTEVVGPVETVEGVRNQPQPQAQPLSIEGEKQTPLTEDDRAQIVERGQQRLLELRKQRSPKEPEAIGDLLKQAEAG
jgi:hypothetical protein